MVRALGYAEDPEREPLKAATATVACLRLFERHGHYCYRHATTFGEHWQKKAAHKIPSVLRRMNFDFGGERVF